MPFRRLVVVCAFFAVLCPGLLIVGNARALEGDEEIRQASVDNGIYGIGVTVVDDNGRVLIQTTISDTPADKAGIRPGSVLAAIDGRPVRTVSEAIAILGGPKGTPVKVSLLPKGGAKAVDYNLIRGYRLN